MNKLSSQQRKLVYGIGIVVLLIPIYILGAPTAEDVQPGTQTEVDGGILAQMRVRHDLGESTLGEIDPSSSAMNLVLLGLRGPAAGVLHLQALDYQKKKDWAKLKTTVDSILKLQPHYVEIWKFQGWNLAFNVSREWDRVDDRFYWVKEGLKFLQQGTTRNQTATILFHNVGDFTGRKIGNADEKLFFRKFFVDDPDDERFGEGKSDPVVNPDGKDNYLVAHDWFQIANEKDRLYRIKGMTHVFARQGPARSLFDYAKARQTDGFFGEENRADWDNAYREWTEEYGNDIFLGLNDIRYKLNSTQDDIVQMAEENGVTVEQQARTLDSNIKMTNYNFWKQLADCERDPLMVQAHQKIYLGKVDYAEGRLYDSEDEQGNRQPSSAEKNLMEGMTLLAQVFEKYPEMAVHDLYIEEGLLALYYWTVIHQANGKEPGPTPMGRYADAYQDMSMEVERQFQIENSRGVRGGF